MPKIAYREQRFNSKARKTVEQAKLIIEDYQQQGYVLTLRQLYYQFVSKNFIANNEQEYKRLGRIITDAREVGEIDWLAIEDRGRQCLLHGHQDDYAKVLKGLEAGIRLNPWLEQDYYVESWIEKAALEGVLERPANRWRSAYMACKGYLSASEAWRAGRRFEKAIATGKKPVLIHLGDHDPSGKDMTRDNGERLALFARQGVQVIRLALNMDQVEQYKPPPNPAKMTDSRAEGYIAQFGKSSWELDALSPAVIDKLVSDQIESFIDKDRWAKTLAREEELRKPLAAVSHRYKEVLDLMLTGEMPLERLARLDTLIPRLTGPSAATYEGLLDRLASQLVGEASYASSVLRLGALEAVKAIDPITDASTMTGVGDEGEEIPEALPAVISVESINAALASLSDAQPGPMTLKLADEARAMIDLLQVANTPTPVPDPTDPEDEPDEEDEDLADDIMEDDDYVPD